MTRYIIYFEPVELDADSLQGAEDKYIKGVVTSIFMAPKILKIIPAKYIFDYDEKETPELSK